MAETGRHAVGHHRCPPWLPPSMLRGTIHRAPYLPWRGSARRWRRCWRDRQSPPRRRGKARRSAATVPSPIFVSLTRGPSWQVDPAWQWPCIQRIVHLFQIWMLFCKICISSYVDPNWVVPILLGSWWSLVFSKNIIWALILEFLEELNWNLKCVFKWMQTCLNCILSSCAPKIMKFVWWAVLND